MSLLPPPPLPEALARRRRLPQLVWVVPLVAALIGLWLVWQAVSQRGPSVQISFLSAEGLEAGKTRIRYKDVDVGEVTHIALSEDRRRVVVTAQLIKAAEPFLVEDTRFWVVRPRVSGGKISGIGTLLSGAYIGVDVGKSETPGREYEGLEVPPIVTNGLPGKLVVLRAADVGSLDVGAPLFYRRLEAGEVVAVDLDGDGRHVTIRAFVHAPFDRYLNAHTRFWNASGVDLSLDANGVRLQSQSLASVVLGGIAFETPGDDPGKGEGWDDKPEPGGETVYELYGDRSAALKAPDGEPLILTLNFEDSIRGLAPGAPVDFRGIAVGEVLSLGVEYDDQGSWFHFPVRVAIYPERIALRPRSRAHRSEAVNRATIIAGLQKAAAERGFRAQLRTGNLLTGQLYVALDFFPNQGRSQIDWSRGKGELPTVRGSFEELQVSLAKVLAKLEKLPLDEIGGDLRTLLQSVDHTVKNLDGLTRRVDQETAPALTATLKDLQTTLKRADQVLAADSPLQQDVRETLKEVSRAAQSFRHLSDTLEREPESLLRGKHQP